MKSTFSLILLFLLVSSINCLNKEKDCKCRILPESKIIGGKQAHHNAYPWIVSLSHQKDETLSFFKRFVKNEKKIDFHSCGGSIINEYWILTAAHCIPENDDQSVYAGYGNDNDLVKIFDFGRIESIKLIPNQYYVRDFNQKTENDIALIKLKKPIKFTDHIKPACFLKKNKNLYSGFLDHAGWGLTEIFEINLETGELSKNDVPRNLKEIFLVDQSDSFEDCKYNENKICAKGVEEGQSSCKGDSGGPIHYTKNGKSYVVGITSYSAEPHFEDKFLKICIGTTVYTRVSNYIDWIKSYVDNDICDF